jgi:peptidyl-tRNA hydrolase ICT1
MNSSNNARTETKATTAYAVKDLFSIMPQLLHAAVRSSKYYTAGNDSLTFHTQTQRSRTANADENREKLWAEVSRIYREHVPSESSADKKKKHDNM